MPVYADLPTSFHSKDNELYMKGEMIRNLPVGRAVIKFRSNTTFLNVPPPRKRTTRAMERSETSRASRQKRPPAKRKQVVACGADRPNPRRADPRATS